MSFAIAKARMEPQVAHLFWTPIRREQALGIFDFFKSSTSSEPRGKKRSSSTVKEVARWAGKAGDRRAQNYDRQEALTALAELAQPLENAEEGSTELEEHEAVQSAAVSALLKRFTFVMDPTITGQEEKQIAYEGILAASTAGLPAIRKYAEKAESIAWPMKITKELLDEEGFVGELLEWLSAWDTEYAKFIDPKIQILTALEEIKDARVREKVSDFLYDVNETARFHAAGATLYQDDPESIPKLVEIFCDEESLRIRNRICEGFIARSWIIPEDQRAEMRKSLPSEYSIDASGLLRRK